MEMTKKALRDICVQNSLYRTPELNDKLYCNYKGFINIANLEEYTNLKALFLEGNSLETLRGLPPLKHLRCLYVQQNCIRDLDGLEGLENLDTLNISNNQISEIGDLSGCPNLTTLIATHNKITSCKSLEHILQCKNLLTVDLQNNDIQDPEILNIFKQLPFIRCLYLKGNPVVSQIKNYRKSIISSLPALTYLDDRPVFEVERAAAEAWAIGGVEAERQARQAHKDAEVERDRRNFEYLQQIRVEGWNKRRQRMNLPEGDTDPVLDAFSDDEWQLTEDPPELVDARKRLAAYTSRPGEEESREMVDARRELVHKGQPIQQGHWNQDQDAQDAEVYFSAVNHDAQNFAATVAASAQLNGGAKNKSETATHSHEELPALEPLFDHLTDVD